MEGVNMIIFFCFWKIT